MLYVQMQDRSLEMSGILYIDTSHQVSNTILLISHYRRITCVRWRQQCIHDWPSPYARPSWCTFDRASRAKRWSAGSACQRSNSTQVPPNVPGWLDGRLVSCKSPIQPFTIFPLYSYYKRHLQALLVNRCHHFREDDGVDLGIEFGVIVSWHPGNWPMAAFAAP